MKRLFVAFALLFMIHSGASATDNAVFNGQIFLNRSEAYQKTYLAGLIDGMMYTDKYLSPAFVYAQTGTHVKDASLLWDDQKQLTYGQIFAIVDNFLKNHPELWQKNMPELVREALQEAYSKMK